MPEAKKTLLHIVAEAALESHLIDDFDRLGIKGYTIFDVRGKGSHGVRSGSWETGSNIRVEVICDEQVAESIRDLMKSVYCNNYAVITYWSDVWVMRGEKF